MALSVFRTWTFNIISSDHSTGREAGKDWERELKNHMLKILLFDGKVSGKTVVGKDLVEKCVEMWVSAANLLFQILLLCCLAFVWSYRSLCNYTRLVLHFWNRDICLPSLLLTKCFFYQITIIFVPFWTFPLYEIWPEPWQSGAKYIFPAKFEVLWK